jgi:hypothetical protein
MQLMSPLSQKGHELLPASHTTFRTHARTHAHERTHARMHTNARTHARTASVYLHAFDGMHELFHSHAALPLLGHSSVLQSVAGFLMQPLGSLGLFNDIQQVFTTSDGPSDHPNEIKTTIHNSQFTVHNATECQPSLGLLSWNSLAQI